MEHYKNYVGQYVKRFYKPFTEDHILKIIDYKHDAAEEEKGTCLEDMYLCSDGMWYDCEDSCIITNEFPIKNIDWVANVNDPQYEGYNPFTGKIKTKDND